MSRHDLSLIAFGGRIIGGIDIRTPREAIVMDGIPEAGDTLIVTCVSDTIQGGIHLFGFPVRRTLGQHYEITVAAGKVVETYDGWIAHGTLVGIAPDGTPEHDAWATVKSDENMGMIYLSFDMPDELKDPSPDDSTGGAPNHDKPAPGATS